MLVCGLVIGVMSSVPEQASACGGCFANTPTVVTRHQMAVAISPLETTLWDQIEYAGQPEDFVWVLPVRGGVQVQLAENAFFQALALETRITMTNAMPPPRCAGGSACPDGAICLPEEPPGDAGAGVTVHYEATIGPYETATVGSTSPDALVTWLNDRGYVVPSAMLPTIRYYVELGMEFAVLRLAPDTSVTQMQPVRVTTPGMNVTFPLRMVAAGVGDIVGLELFVLAEGRYGVQNFANAEVDRSRLLFDWRSGYNYAALYDEAMSTNGGRVWITEHAMPANRTAIESYATLDPEGVVHRASGDWAVVMRGLGSPYLTRLTTDMQAELLIEDLVLSASPGGNLDNEISVTTELNRPRCPGDPDRGCSAGIDGPRSPCAVLGSVALLLLRRRRRA